MHTEIITFIFLVSSLSYSELNAEKTIDGTNSIVNYLNTPYQELNLSVTPSIIDVASDAGNVSFSISSNTNWTVSDDADWLTLETSGGNGNTTLSVTFSANSVPSLRIGTITISGTGVNSQVVTVTQRPLYIMLISKEQLFFGCNWSQESITVTSNTDWTVTLDPEAWFLSVNPLSGSGIGKIFVQGSSQWLTSDLETYIDIGLSDGTFRRVRVYLFNPMFIINPRSQNVGSGAGSTTFNTFQDGGGGLILSLDVLDDADWLSESPQPLMPGMQLIATYTANPLPTARVGTITINSDCIYGYNITVTQEGSIPTGTSDSEENHIEVFPNPVKDILFIEGLTHEAKVSIYDSQGTMILNKQALDNGLDISRFASGVYTLKIDYKSKVITRRFIKQ